MYNLSLIDDNSNYVCPEFKNTTNFIINTDMLYEYLKISRHKITNVVISKIEFKPLVFVTDFTNKKLEEIDVTDYRPVILITGLTFPEGKSYMCIDGKHRLNKLHMSKVEKCKAYVIDYKVASMFLNRF